MARLPVVSGRKLARALIKHEDWEERNLGRKQKTKGSHQIVLTKKDHLPLTVVDHKELGVGLLGKLMNAAGIDRDRLDEIL